MIEHTGDRAGERVPVITRRLDREFATPPLVARKAVK
jgi:hypothetical protein